ncbi:MAG: PA domain-containing protein [Thiohalomonadales bacterium]
MQIRVIKKYLKKAILYLLALLLIPMLSTASTQGQQNNKAQLALLARGDSQLLNLSADLWALDEYVYQTTFSRTCGAGTGIQIYKPSTTLENVVSTDKNNTMSPPKTPQLGFIPSVLGSDARDVKVANMNSGRILIHSNEPCRDGGLGGFEIWNVESPENPVHLAHIQVDDVNATLRNIGAVDVGIHNLFLFSKDEKDYVAVVANSVFGNLQIFNITDPVNPTLVSSWGTEELCDLPKCSVDPKNETDLSVIMDTMNIWNNTGFGNLQFRSLHDVTINNDATRAYLSNFDTGLVLLDLSDPTNLKVISVALDLTADGDQEVNSHSAWPNENGDVVVETNEDFSAFEIIFTIDSGANSGEYAANEGLLTTRGINTLPNSTMQGLTTYVGSACTDSTPVPVGTGIAVIQQDVCRFSEIAQNVMAAGYTGMIVFNQASRGDKLPLMFDNFQDIPGIFVGHSTGLAIFNATTAADITVGDKSVSISAKSVANGWGGVRIWDYSDPENPVIASTFDTLCSAHPTDLSCDPEGNYTVHNVIVENDKAYISWMAEGVLVLDISDPYYPVEIARFHGEGVQFEAANNGIQDVWGIYKETDKDLIYISDTNGGLYVLKLQE